MTLTVLPMHTLRGTITELCVYCEGYYLVTTQGSTHLWQPERQRYMRRPGPLSRAIGFRPEDDYVWLSPDHIQIWPVVGKCFLVYFGEDRYHRSSKIVSIEVVTKHGLPHD